MTDWARLAEPFPDTEVKERQGPRKHDGACQKQYGVCQLPHRMLSYIDARAVAQRLDDVVTPEGWDFTWTLLDGSVVHGRLTIGNAAREDAGYPNSDDDAEPVKSAVSDALKRCAVLFGIGRHLYDDNHSGAARPAPRPAPVRPHVVDTSVPDIDEDWLPPADARPRVLNEGTDTVTCPIHNVAWAGQPGDLWHKDPEGKYCRHPNNVRKARAR